MPADWLAGLYAAGYRPLDGASPDPMTHPAFTRFRAALDAVTERGERAA